MAREQAENKKPAGLGWRHPDVLLVYHYEYWMIGKAFISSQDSIFHNLIEERNVCWLFMTGLIALFGSKAGPHVLGAHNCHGRAGLRGSHWRASSRSKLQHKKVISKGLHQPTKTTTQWSDWCRGLVACATFFVLFGVTQTPDGPFIRPHPGRPH